MDPSETEPASSVILRFTLNAADFTAIAQSNLLDTPEKIARGRRIAETFMDTADFTLAHSGVSLSLTKARRGYVQSLRWDGAVVDAPVPEAAPDLARFGPEWAAQLPELLQGVALLPVFSTAIKRVIRHAGEVELRFENGAIQAGASKLPVRELELRGQAEPVYRLALALADGFTLQLQPASLAARGAWAAGAPGPKAVKAGPGLTSAPSLDEAVVALTQSCLTQFTANWPAFALGDEVNAVHQLRVAMRRLRSVLGLFNREFASSEFSAFRNEAKRLANLMGEARNWDVFTALLNHGPAAAFPHEPGFAGLFGQCAQLRAAGYAAVRAMLADPGTTRFLLAIELFLARRGWRNGLEIAALPGLAAPAKGFAATNLARLHRKVRKRGRHLMRIGAHERHLVRIELKKLRYAADLFGGLFEARGKIRAYTATAAALQEELGLLNDLATARELLGRLDGETPERARAVGIVLGWTAQAALADDRTLAKSWKAFGESKPFTD